MNCCPNDGYLVGSKHEVPADPTIRAVDGLSSVVGCNRLRCLRCGVLVRNAADLCLAQRQADLASLYDASVLIPSSSGALVEGPAGQRLYFCRCRHWEEDDVQALKDDDPDAYRSSPDVPWRCDGHPLIALPHNIEGTIVWSQAELRALASRALHDALTGQDADWLVRLHHRLNDGDGVAIREAALAGMEDSDPQVRTRALRYFSHVPYAPACSRLIELLHSDSMRGSEEAAWNVLESQIASPGPARELARSYALGGRGNRSLFQTLAAGDTDWFLQHGPEMALATPAHAEDLFNSFAQVPDEVIMGPEQFSKAQDRVRQTIAGMITLDEALERTMFPLAAWDCGEHYRPRLCIYQARTWGAMLMKGDFVQPAELEPWNERVRARQGRVGASHAHSEVVWMFEDEACGVWNKTRQLARGNAQRLLLEGSFVNTSDIAAVGSFVDATPDSVHRGVYCTLLDGRQRRVHEERDDDPPEGPEYTGEAVEWESAWVWALGADLATWLGVPHAERTSGVLTNTRQLKVRGQLLAFARDLLTGGADEFRVCALGEYDDETLSLRWQPDPAASTPGGSLVLVIVGSFGTRERIMKAGPLAQVTRYLRHFITPRRLLAAAGGGF